MDTIQGMTLLVIGVVAVSIVFVWVAPELGSEYTEMGQGVASISVPMVFFGLALVTLASRDAPTGTLAFVGGMAGLIFAYILNTLYTNGILIDEFITGSITIADLMTVVAIFWLMVGVLLEVMRR